MRHVPPQQLPLLLQGLLGRGGDLSKTRQPLDLGRSMVCNLHQVSRVSTMRAMCPMLANVQWTFQVTKLSFKGELLRMFFPCGAALSSPSVETLASCCCIWPAEGGWLGSKNASSDFATKPQNCNSIVGAGDGLKLQVHLPLRPQNCMAQGSCKLRTLRKTLPGPSHRFHSLGQLRIRTQSSLQVQLTASLRHCHGTFLGVTWYHSENKPRYCFCGC